MVRCDLVFVQTSQRALPHAEMTQSAAVAVCDASAQPAAERVVYTGITTNTQVVHCSCCITAAVIGSFPLRCNLKGLLWYTQHTVD